MGCRLKNKNVKGQFCKSKSNFKSFSTNVDLGKKYLKVKTYSTKYSILICQFDNLNLREAAGINYIGKCYTKIKTDIIFDKNVLELKNKVLVKGNMVCKPQREEMKSSLCM